MAVWMSSHNGRGVRWVLKTVQGGVQQQSGGGGIADFSFSEGSGDGQMGKLEFLELLTAQLKHQDPMAPADDKAFIAQLAQFSALEQQMKGNDMLSRIEMAQGAMLTSQATGLIGKEVTAEGDQIFDPMRQLHRFVSRLMMTQQGFG